VLNQTPTHLITLLFNDKAVKVNVLYDAETLTDNEGNALCYAAGFFGFFVIKKNCWVHVPASKHRYTDK